MVRVSSLANLRPWSELTAKMVMGPDGGGSWVGERSNRVDHMLQSEK